MNMLYDSDSFVVVHFQADAPLELLSLHPSDAAPAPQNINGLVDTPLGPRLARHGFEIVDKRSGKEIYLDGSWAEMFQEQIVAWQRDTPTQEEVEDTLDRYTALAHNPVIVH